MQKLLGEALTAWAGDDGDARALDELRKVLAVGVACAEAHELPARAEEKRHGP